jgi:hypothetical protein
MYCLWLVTSHHINPLHLVTKRLNFSRRHIAQHWALAWGAYDPSFVVNAMRGKGKERCPWIMPLGVDASNNEIVECGIGDHIFDDLINPNVLRLGLPHNR